MVILALLFAAVAGCFAGVLAMALMHAAGEADDAAQAQRDEAKRLAGLEPRGNILRLVTPPKDAA